MDIQQVVELVHGAKQIIFDSGLAHQVIQKGLADYVTQVDLQVQEYLGRELARRWP